MLLPHMFSELARNFTNDCEGSSSEYNNIDLRIEGSINADFMIKCIVKMENAYKTI